MTRPQASAQELTEVFIGGAGTRFAADGRCTDDNTRHFVGAQRLAFERWIATVGRMRGS